ncbi:MAG: hydrogenase [Pseudomonadota bacterium]
MTAYANGPLVALLVLDLYMVSTTRLDACIRASIVQALVLAALPFALGGLGTGMPLAEQMHLLVLAGATQVVKGIVIPMLLFRALRDLGSHRECEPYVSLHYSLIVNGALCGAGFWIASALPWPAPRTHTIALGVALATILVGLYMTVNRRKPISQVLGYLVIESGLFVAGWSLLERPSLLVELGILLDLLVAAMVMGVLATRIDASPEEDECSSVATTGGCPREIARGTLAPRTSSSEHRNEE